MTLSFWFRSLIHRVPHFIIGGENDPYMFRWFLLPRNPLFNLYLHKFLRDDSDVALHDHPWRFLSFILSGSYAEVTDRGTLRRQRWSLAYRPAEHRHRVVLDRDGITGQMLPCWTIVLTGRKFRSWGFWCPQGFVHWRKFVDPEDPGAHGAGCGDV